MVHMASSCLLTANGSLGGFDLTVAFNKNPLVCYDPDAYIFYPCDGWLLHDIATLVAIFLNNNATWVQRAEARRQACTELAAQFWAHTALRRSEHCCMQVERCKRALHGIVAWGCCTGVMLGRCTGMLQRELHGDIAQEVEWDIAWGHSKETEWEIAKERCMGTLHRALQGIHARNLHAECAETLHGNAAWGHCMRN